MDTTSTSTPAIAPAAAGGESATVPPVVISPAATETPRKHAYGSLLSIILIVAIFVFGAFYVWGERIATQEAPAASAP